MNCKKCGRATTILLSVKIKPQQNAWWCGECINTCVNGDTIARVKEAAGRVPTFEQNAAMGNVMTHGSNVAGRQL